MRKIGGKRGQFEISFGMIFSIIIIIATVITAFYVIRYFLDLNKCSDASAFYDGLQTEVSKAWNSRLYSGDYEGKLPSNIEYVCFWNNTFAVTGRKFLTQYNSVKEYTSVVEKKNVYLYPPERACKGAANYNLKYANIQGFNCFPVNNSRVKIPLSIGSFDSLVKIGSDKGITSSTGTTGTGSAGGGGSSGAGATGIVSTGTISGAVIATEEKCARMADNDFCEGLEFLYGKVYIESCCDKFKRCC